MNLFDVIPTPTPVPSVAQIQNELGQLTAALGQSLNKSQDYVTNTGLLGVVFAGMVIYAFVTWLRRSQGGETGKALTTVTDLYQKELVRSEKRDEKQEQREKSFADERKLLMDRMDANQKEHSQAYRDLTGAMLKWADVGEKTTLVLENVEKENKIQNALVLGMHENLNIMTTQGSQPVQLMRGDLEAVKRDLETVKKMTSDILEKLLPCPEAKTAVTSDVASIVRETLINMGLIEASVRTGVQEEQKRRTDSQPIPTITVAPETT